VAIPARLRLEVFGSRKSRKTNQSFLGDEKGITTDTVTMVSQFINLFKLRIGVVITLAALGGMAITPGQALTSWQILVLSLTVMFWGAWQLPRGRH